MNNNIETKTTLKIGDSVWIKVLKGDIVQGSPGTVSDIKYDSDRKVKYFIISDICPSFQEWYEIDELEPFADIDSKAVVQKMVSGVQNYAKSEYERGFIEGRELAVKDITSRIRRMVKDS